MKKSQVADEGVRGRASLDGSWRIIFDRENKGKRESWSKREVFELQEQKLPIQVPSCWEETEQDYEGVAWYGRDFSVPDAWKDKVIRLKFGAVNYIAEVWLNDAAVGFHEGGYTPFELDISDLVKFGEDNFLLVRVVGPAVTKEEIDCLAQDEAPHWRGAIAGGIWQSVEMIATDMTYVRDVFVEPRLSEELAIAHLEIDNARLRKKDVTAIFKVFGSRESSRIVVQAEEKLKLSPGINELSVNLNLSNPIPWSPENPHLYVLETLLKADGEVIDLVKTRFGMREFTIRGGHFHLNGERIYLKAGFWEGLYPTTLAYPKDAEFVRNEILLAKEAGFNTLRPWRKPPPPPILDLADELGICIIDCPPIECMRQWPRETPRLESRVANEVKELVLRDRNHPSVIYWEIFNEIIKPCLVRLMHKTVLTARRFDPARLIVDESGGSRSPWGAHAYLPYSTEPMEIIEKHSYLRSPVDGKIYDFYLTFGEPDKVTFVSEVGYGALPDLVSNVERYEREGNPKTPDYRYHKYLLESLEKCIEELGLEEVFGNASDVCLATQEIQAVGNKLQLEALRINPNMDGYCLHAFTGGDWVIGAGIVDLWRNPKKAYFEVQKVNEPLYLAVRVNPRNVYPGQEVNVKVTAVNELAKTECSLMVEVKSSEGREIYQKEEKAEIGTGIQLLADLNLKPEGSSEQYIATARLEKDGANLSENTYPFLAFGEGALETPTQEFAIVDPGGLLKPFLTERGLRFNDFTTGDGMAKAVFVSTAHANEPDVFEKFVYLIDFVKRGGVAVFLSPPISRFLTTWHDARPQKNILHSTELFPFKLQSKAATGNWVGVYHYVKEHPLLEGLPFNCFMGQDYQNVCATRTLTELEGETVVGALSWSYTTDYSGPRDFWWGSDLAIVPYGRGKMILSTLQLIENLGEDPIADKIFYNMVAFAASESTKPLEPVGEDLECEVAEYMERFEVIRTRQES